MKNVIIGIFGVLVILVMVSFVLPEYSLKMGEYWKPKFQSVERKNFEQTRSYVEGAAMDLGKYYQEYQNKTEETDKEAIKKVVSMRFSNLDENTINSYELRNFLKSCRGY